jgi:hypothetical protein
MRGLAIFLSPLVGILVVWSGMMIFAESPEYNLMITLCFIAYIVALSVQFFIEFIILLVESWGKITFKFYFSIAFYSCVGIGIISFLSQDSGSFYQKLPESIGAFLLFFAYSVCNCIVYNYLYFSKLTQNKT